VLVKCIARRGDRDRGGRLQRVAVDAGRDGGQRDATAVVLGRQRERGAVARAQQLGLVVSAAAPDRPDGVDDVAHRQAPRAGDLRLTRVAAAEQAAFLE